MTPTPSELAKAEPGHFHIRSATSADALPLHALLCANGWQHRVRSVGWLAELIAKSQRAAVAVLPEQQVVGFLRGITDGLSNGYLSMLVVAEAHRRRGIGSALVRQVTFGTPEVMWALQAGRPGTEAFFASLGFVKAPLAMQRPRAQSVI